MFTPMQPYTFVNKQSLHDAGKFYVKNAQNRDLANLVILDQLQNKEYLAKVRYYTNNGINKFGLDFYVPPARPIFISNPLQGNTTVQVNTKTCTDKAEGAKALLKRQKDEGIKAFNDRELDVTKRDAFLASVNKNYEEQLKTIEEDEKKCITELQPNVTQHVQQNGAIVTDGRVLASNQGMLVPGMLPMMPVATPVAYPNRFVVAPYYSGVSYNLSPVVNVFNNDGLPRYLKR